MITVPRSAELTPARTAMAARLEQEYENHTERLAALLASRARQSARTARRRGPDTAYLARVEDARRGIAQVAQALRRLAEGSYGICETCGFEIPLEELEADPAVSSCRTCGTISGF
ncbi:MAG: DnaK suppressor protein [Actinomycetota bacterium]|nr:DnaK suppressor protein [Actinomycetota bacterium]